MTKREGIYFGLGCLREFEEQKKDYKLFRLEELFGEKYARYALGIFTGNVVVFDTITPKVEGSIRRRVISVPEDFDGDQMVELILAAISYDMKNRKEKKE